MTSISRSLLATFCLLVASLSLASPAADNANGNGNDAVRRSGSASSISDSGSPTNNKDNRDKSGKRDDGDVPRRGVTFHRDDDLFGMTHDDNHNRNRHHHNSGEDSAAGRTRQPGSGIRNGIISNRSPLLSSTDNYYGSGFQDYDPYYGRLDGDFFRRYWDRYGQGSYDKFYDRNTRYRDPSYGRPSYQQQGQRWNRNCYYGGYGCGGREGNYNGGYGGRYDDRYRQDDPNLSGRFRYARMFFPQNTAYRLRGRDVQLRCIFPEATIRGRVSWYPPGRELDYQSGSKYRSYESAETAILEIKDFDRSDFGTYRCYATINRGYDNYRAEEVYQDVYFHPSGHSGGRYDDPYYGGGRGYGRYNDEDRYTSGNRYRYLDLDDDYGFAYYGGGDRTRYRYMDRRRRNLGAKTDGIDLLEGAQQRPPILITNSGFTAGGVAEERSDDEAARTNQRSERK